MIITVASPDKLSISMFLSFMQFCLGKEHKPAMTQSLWASEAITTFINETLEKSDKILFSYYAKGKKDLKLIPEKFLEVSDVVIWMDLYSMNWVIVKNNSSQTPVWEDRWKKNIAKMVAKR